MAPGASSSSISCNISSKTWAKYGRWEQLRAIWRAWLPRLEGEEKEGEGERRKGGRRGGRGGGRGGRGEGEEGGGKERREGGGRGGRGEGEEGEEEGEKERRREGGRERRERILTYVHTHVQCAMTNIDKYMHVCNHDNSTSLTFS